MSNLDETLEREFKAKCKKHLLDKRDKELRDLRDHFAGLAMQGMMANSDYSGNTATEISKFAYVQADAMLKQRSL